MVGSSLPAQPVLFLPAHSAYAADECLLDTKSIVAEENSMTNGDDPTARRRQDKERMNERDAEAWRQQKQGWSVRAIARELGMAPSSAQRCYLERALAREQKMADALATGEPSNVSAVDDELTCDDELTPFDVSKLSVLELYRLRHVPDLPADVQTALASAWAALPRPETTGRITDDDGSWRERCDRAMSGATDPDDEWPHVTP